MTYYSECVLLRRLSRNIRVKRTSSGRHDNEVGCDVINGANDDVVTFIAAVDLIAAYLRPDASQSDVRRRHRCMPWYAAVATISTTTTTARRYYL